MKRIALLFAILMGFSDLSYAQEEVFYSSYRPQGWDIYLSKDDGFNFSRFTEHESLDYDAKISVDGQWVVFTSERNGRPQLFIKNTDDNSNPRLLVSSNSMQDQVDFSPDGQWIVFVSSHQGNADIYRLPFKPLETLNISDAVNLTNDPSGDFRPSFSNNGQYIAFSSDRAHEIMPHPRFVFAMRRTGDIYVLNVNTLETKRLTKSSDWEGSPVWSADDQHIVYYSANREAPFRIKKMDANGDNHEQISLDDISSMSPLVINDERMLFTKRNGDSRAYSILEINTKTKELSTQFVQAMDMFNVDYHPSGIMVYHGGVKPQNSSTNLNEFAGDLLVKNSPQVVNDLPNQPLFLFGVRRSIAAPATPDGKIVYAVSNVNSFQSAITPFAFVVLLLPALAVFWLIFGVFKSIKNRKTIAFWKYLLLSIIALVIVVFIVKTTDDQLFATAIPLNQVKSFLFVITIILLVFSGLFWFMFKTRDKQQQPTALLYKHYSLVFFPYSLVTLYAGFFLSSFFNTDQDFYVVDYQKNKIEHLFNFHPDGDFNPRFANIIDSKVTPDGEYLHFTVGGFRQSSTILGGVYRYHFKDKSIELMTELEGNNGFADYSANNKVMVYRSGKTGNMDIYVKENGSTINLTNSEAKEAFPAISNDGNKIVFCSDATGIDKNGIVKTMDIFIVERQENGWSAPKQLTNYAGQEAHPHFSPDGEWLIYTSEEFGINDEQPLVQPYIFNPQMYGEIVAMRLSDQKTFRLTHNKWEDGAPLWLKK